MPQLEVIPQGWELVPREKDSLVQLKSSDPHCSRCDFSFQILSGSSFRITFTSAKHGLPLYPSCAVPKPALDDVDLQVSDLGQFQKVFTINQSLRITIKWESTPEIHIDRINKGIPHLSQLYADLPFRSYVLDGPGIAHYTTYQPSNLHVGLGEKAAPFDLSSRTFRLAATDSFGYDGHKSDPLYKHIPLLISASPVGCVAQFSTSHARGMLSVGGEMDGLWGKYKVLRQDYGGLEEYLLVGHTLKDITRIYADLVGYPRLVPRWACGYIAGGMKYSMLDDPPASEALEVFAERMKKERIPCSAFQLSSGYTVAEVEPKTRNVFTWNKKRFPDPKAFLNRFRGSGIRVIANVKPYVLANHPAYSSLKAKGALFTNPISKQTAVTRLWSAGGGESGEGSHLDFTSASAYQWWYNGVRELMKVGIIGVWNDNNEYTIPHDNWECKLDNKHLENVRHTNENERRVGYWGRSLHAEIMAKASFNAARDESPNARPYVLTRSATAGTMRYAASSWSGDNVTSWASMRAGNAMSLNAGLSLLTCYGHDIGGFEGPQPSPELLVRWISMSIYSPRFAINCFKTSSEDNKVGDVIEVWMYPEVTPIIRRAIKRRYELIPYIYSLLIEAHLYAIPPQRWTGWGYETDETVWHNNTLREGETQYWFGSALLVCGVFSPNVSTALVYLPRTAHDHLGFVHLDSSTKYSHYAACHWVTVNSSPSDAAAVFAKLGSAIPIGRDEQCLSPGEPDNPANLPLDDFRGVEIYPPVGEHDNQEFGAVWYEDDGYTEGSPISRFTFKYICHSDKITVLFHESLPKQKRYWSELNIFVPFSDERVLYDDKDIKLEEHTSHKSGFVRYVLAIEEVV